MADHSLPSWDRHTTATSNALFNVDVVDQEVIWAAGGGLVGDPVTDGSVVRTADGGQTWLDVTPPEGASQLFRDVEAVDAQRALVLAVGDGPASRIYRTVDGGEPWTVVFTNRDDHVLYSGMAFFGDRRGLVVGDSVAGSFPILRTVDGGESWESVSWDGMPPALEGEGVFATGTSIVTVGEHDAWFGTTAAGHSPRVFHTVDGGATWTVADTPIPPSPDPRDGLRSLSFRDRRHGLAVSGTPPSGGNEGVGFAARTSDGGATWDLVGATNGFRNGVVWISGQTAVAVGKSGSDVSTDQGDTWTRFDDFFLLGVDCSSAHVCWAVGDEGQAARLIK